MKKRLLIALLAGGAVFATVFGVAASLNVTSDSLGAGGTTVTSCDDAVNVSYTPEFQGGQFKVTKVTVSDINIQTCNGKKLTVQLTSGGAAILGATNSTPVTIDSVTEEVTLDTAAPAADVTDVHVVITG